MRTPLTVLALAIIAACSGESTAPTTAEPWAAALRAGVDRANRDFAGNYRAAFLAAGDSAIDLTLDPLSYDVQAAYVEEGCRFSGRDCSSIAIDSITRGIISGTAHLLVGGREYTGGWYVETRTHADPWLSGANVYVTIIRRADQFGSGVSLAYRNRDTVVARPAGTLIDPGFNVTFVLNR